MGCGSSLIFLVNKEVLHPSPADAAGLEKNPNADADVTVDDAPDVTVAEAAPNTFTLLSVSCSDKICARRCFKVAKALGHSVQR